MTQTQVCDALATGAMRVGSCPVGQLYTTYLLNLFLSASTLYLAEGYLRAVVFAYDMAVMLRAL
jgi:hypothetical protein